MLNYDPREFNSRTHNEEFENDIEKIILKNAQHELYFHMSKLLNGKIQIVLVAGTKYDDEINEIAKTMRSTLSSCKL